MTLVYAPPRFQRLPVKDDQTGKNLALLQLAIPNMGAIQSVTSAYTMIRTDGLVLADATAAALTVTLPDAAVAQGLIFTVKKVDAAAHNVTVTAAGTSTIDGATTVVLSAQYAQVTVRSDGVNWWEIVAPVTSGTTTLTGNVTGSGTSSIATTIAAGVVTNAMLAAPISFANGGLTGSAATSATTGTMTVSMTTAIVTITPTGDCTFNASGGVVGQRTTFAITTSGASSFTLTFGTNFHKTGTLVTGYVSARFFAVTFVCVDGTTWWEEARTAIQT